MKLVKTFIHSNIYLSVAAVLLTISAQIQLGMPPRLEPYLLLIFFATLFEYNRHRLFRLITGNNTLISDMNWWVRRKQRNFFVLVFISLIGFLTAVINTKTEVLLTFLMLGILTLFYSVPFADNKNYFFKLREIPYLKIFLIAFIWSASTIFLTVIQAGDKIFNSKVLLLFSERFFFIFAIAIPFDIRDMQADREAGLKTIPLLIDKKKALLLSYFSLFFCFLISLFHYRIHNEWFIIEAICISIITTMLFLKLQFFKNLGRYYYPVLDGALLLQGLLVLGFYFIKHY